MSRIEGLWLVLGGTRSGKSERGEQLARASGRRVAYLACADAGDPAMRERIARHRARRPDGWQTIEVGDDLSGAVAGVDRAACLLLDGLGTWIAGVLHRLGALAPAPPEAVIGAARARVRDAVDALVARGRSSAPTIVVAEQAGEGLLPADQGSRLWLDLLGDAVRRLADGAAGTELVVAGRVLPLGSSPPGSPSHATPAGGLDDTVPVGLAPPLPPAADDWQRDHELAALRRHGDAEVAPGLADHAVTVAGERPPPWLHRALQRALAEDVARYPDPRPAQAALARWHGRAVEEIVPTNGGAEALWALAPALRPRRAAIVCPSFSETEAGLRTYGVPVTRVLRTPQRDFELRPSDVPDDADLVVVTNPAAASGTLASREQLLALRRPGRLLVIDEAFVDFAPDPDAVSLAPLQLPDVIVVRSATKLFAVPGIRAGWVVAPAPLAARLRAVLPPWSANALALAVLRAVAEEPAARRRQAARARERRRDLAARLAELDDLTVFPGVAPFCLVRVPDGPRVAARLRELGFAVRRCGNFAGLGDDYLRLTAREPRANARLVGALERALGELAAERPPR